MPAMYDNYLLRCLQLAESRRGLTAPNPAVGALVVRNGQTIAEGVHYRRGAPHAEAVALGQSPPSASQGATLYVSLEPCCHWGKTPPCTDLIIERGIKRVVYGYIDPNPDVVAGQSIVKLQAAGIDCSYHPIPEIEAFYRSYAYWRNTGRPFVTAKLALSLDGKIAGPQGEPIAITGAAANRHTHQHRKHSDAILTTITTIINDNPRLNARLDNETIAKPVFVLDSRLRIPLTAKILTTAQSTTVFHRADADFDRRQRLKAQQIQCQPVSHDKQGLDLIEVMVAIGRAGHHDLWVEAGGHCFQTLLKMGIINRAFIYIAPKWLGKAAYSAFNHDTVRHLITSAGQCNWQSLVEDGLCELTWE